MVAKLMLLFLIPFNVQLVKALEPRSESDSASACHQFIDESEYSQFIFLGNFLMGEPWVRNCVELDANKVRALRNFVNNTITPLQDDQITEPQLRKLARDYQKMAGIDLFSLAVANRQSQSEEIFYPPMNYLFYGVLYDYQLYSLMSQGNVYTTNADGSSGKPFSLDPSLLQSAKLKRAKSLEALKYIKQENPEYFFCNLAKSYIYASVDVRDDYQAEKGPHQLDPDFMNFLSLQKQQYLTKVIHFFDKGSFPVAFGDDEEETKIEDTSEFADVFSLFKHDGLWTSDRQFSCEYETPGPAIPIYEIHLDLTSGCLQKGLNEVIALDPNPVHDGYHYSGAGGHQCQFVLAHWKITNNNISTLRGRFVNESGQKINLECRQIKVESATLVSPPEACVQF